ncbi:MAG: type I-B CRISPR-associated protein Cas7/Cst2/DevR [Candidatus Nanoclepta minutus]|uniref:Type I-B CRISPR-associated protein Cas7/Cst2/DevR n=1 Tax=Candidatus Nanoclepta minutus TaxID=1940235 RepID=A0A397WQQ9_9ARCH|nr:MAG: type I-B CRISPR-associated protein Cas7/Cst2/DevR [Candidatus Nanoclepta minutus]
MNQEYKESVEVKNPRFIQFVVVTEVEGNVNADESVGTRITIKKFVTREGIYPYVSSRAIKKGIRLALERDYGFKTDPFETLSDTQIGKKQEGDSGNFLDYIDQDLFGYMVTKAKSQGEKGGAWKRKAPVEMSYLISFFPIPVTTEFAGRFPKRENPIPFEIEQAKFLGRFYGIIYNYIGVFHKEEVVDKEDEDRNLKNILGEVKNSDKVDQNRSNEKMVILKEEERKKRLRALLEIILAGKFVLPRSTDQLNQGNYKYVVVALTNSIKPLSAFVNIKYQKDREYEIFKEEKDGKIIEKVVERFSEGYQLDIEKLREFANMLEGEEKLYVIDYVGNLKVDNRDKIIVKKPSEIKNLVEDILKNLDLNNFNYYLKFYE